MSPGLVRRSGVMAKSETCCVKGRLVVTATSMRQLLMVLLSLISARVAFNAKLMEIA